MSQISRSIVDFDQVRLFPCSAVQPEIGKIRLAHDMQHDSSANEEDDGGGERRDLGTHAPFFPDEPGGGADAANSAQVEQVGKEYRHALFPVLFGHADALLEWIRAATMPDSRHKKKRAIELRAFFEYL